MLLRLLALCRSVAHLAVMKSGRERERERETFLEMERASVPDSAFKLLYRIVVYFCLSLHFKQTAHSIAEQKRAEWLDFLCADADRGVGRAVLSSLCNPHYKVTSNIRDRHHRGPAALCWGSVATNEQLKTCYCIQTLF